MCVCGVWGGGFPTKIRNDVTVVSVAAVSPFVSLRVFKMRLKTQCHDRDLGDKSSPLSAPQISQNLMRLLQSETTSTSAPWLRYSTAILSSEISAAYNVTFYV